MKMIALLLPCALAVSGCKSEALIVYPSNPTPPAWLLEPAEPNYTQRLLQLLLESPETPTTSPSDTTL